MSLRARFRSTFFVLLGLFTIAFAFRPSAAAATTIDLTTSGASVTDGQGVIWSDGAAEAGGTGVFGPFLREQADDVETAFNTDATPVPLDGKVGSWTHSLKFSSLTPVTVGETTYYSFRLDANELSAAPEYLLGLDGLKVFSAADPAIPDYDTLVSSGHLWYAMDPEQDVHINTSLHPGSGAVDITVLIPTSYFSDVASGDYFYLYASFGHSVGDGLSSSDGFEEWSALQETVDHPPAVTAPLAINGEEGGFLTFGVSASDPDGDPISSLTADLGSLPEGDASFTPDEGNLTGTFHWHMLVGDAGSYGVTFTATAGDLSSSATTHILVGPAGINIAGVFTWTPNPGDEGVYHIVFSATDEGGTSFFTSTITIVPPILAPRPSAPLAGQAPRAIQKGPIISGTGTVSGSPGTPLNVSVTASTDFSGGSAAPSGTLRVARISKAASAAQTTTLTVDTSELPVINDATFVVDQQPVVAGPTAITVTPGATLSLTRTATDPDGDAIDSFTANLAALPGSPATFTVSGSNTSGTVAWTPTVADIGSYVVSFSAANRLVGVGSTTITVSAVLDARFFVADPVKINIGSARPMNCVYLEPVAGSFELTDVDLSTLKMISVGTGDVSEIPAISGKPAVVDDRDHNLVPDLEVCFSKANLRALFGHLSGKNQVPVQLHCQLVSGALFEGTATVWVIANGPNSGAVSVAPNPLNPQAKLSLTLAKPGSLRINLYDTQGRLVREVAREENAVTGPRVFTIDGLDSKGLPLASGVYFYRVESGDGVHLGRLAIVR